MSKEFWGRVLNDKMDKTVTVGITKFILHPRFKKYIKKTTKVYAHDENNECRYGDKVLIRETRPLSKLKRWIVIKRIEK